MSRVRSYVGTAPVRTGKPLPPPAKALAESLLAKLDPSMSYGEAKRAIRMLLILRGVKANSAAIVAGQVMKLRVGAKASGAP